MEANKPIPGTKQFRQQIFELKGELRKCDDSIRENEKKIDEIKKNEQKNSPKYSLVVKSKELNTEIKELMSQRRELYGKVEEITDMYGDIGEKKNEVRVMSTAAIDKRLKDINLEMLKYPCTSQKSKTIEEEIRDLKIKKKDIESEQKKSEIMRQVQDKYYGFKSEIRDLNKQIYEKKSEQVKLMEQIKEIESQDDKKNPLVESLEKSIKDLKSKKEEINNKIAKNQEEIAKKKEEYDLYLQKKAIQEAYEKRRKAILDRIQEFEDKRVDLLVERENCDSNKFDSLIFALKNKKEEKSGTVTFPLDIVMNLSGFKIKMPSQYSQIACIIKELEKKKCDFVRDMASRIKELDLEVESLDEAMAKERVLLAEIPVTEVKITFTSGKQGNNK